MELQLPFIRRILAEHPNVECHLWNLTHNDADKAYVTSITGDRITVHHDFFGQPHRFGWGKVYQHYSQPEYSGSIFVKLDDDIVFIETPRFGTFISAIAAHPGTVVTANVINNGACTPLHPELWNKFEQLGIPLLDVHKSSVYADHAHNYFFHHHYNLLDQPVRLIPTKDWLSINTVGYDWTVAQQFAHTVGMIPHPPLIAGREFPAPWGVGDEGAMNMLPRIILEGFTTCHLSYGPQECPPEQLDAWRAEYAAIGEDYLASVGPDTPQKLPQLSPLSWKCPGIQPPGADHKDSTEWATRSGWQASKGDNDPTVGRWTP